MKERSEHPAAQGAFRRQTLWNAGTLDGIALSIGFGEGKVFILVGAGVRVWARLEGLLNDLGKGKE